MPFKYSTPRLLNWTYSEGALGNRLSYKSRADLKLHGPGKLRISIHRYLLSKYLKFDYWLHI